MLGALSLALFFQKKRAQAGQTCGMNLKIVTRAWMMWPPYSEEVSPWRYVGPGSTAAFTNSGTVLPHYQALSNDIPNTKVLTCPSDTRNAATNWSTLNDSNISYFINFDATQTRPMRVAFGDRLFTSTTAPTNNLLILSTNATYQWQKRIHNGCGTVGFSDGYARMLTDQELVRVFHSKDNVSSPIQLPK